VSADHVIKKLGWAFEIVARVSFNLGHRVLPTQPHLTHRPQQLARRPAVWRYVSFSYHLVLVHELAQQGLLDFSREFDVSLMDKVVMAFYTGHGQEVCLLFQQLRWKHADDAFMVDLNTATNGTTGLDPVSRTS
jgi:hypothetical protein